MIEEEVKLEPGMKVRYVSARHGDCENNPLWGGRYGKVVGIITEVNHTDSELPILVKFPQLGEENSYHRHDLALLDDARSKTDKEPEHIERKVDGIFNI